MKQPPRTTKLERITAKQMTAVLRARFDVSYYALSWRGYREVCRLLDGTTMQPVTDITQYGGCCDAVRGRTWAEALQKAREHFKWTHDVTEETTR